jgi:hypothetical protein
VISIGSDNGFSDAGIGGTARGMTCGLAGGVVGADCTSALCSAGAGGGLLAEFAAVVESGQRAAGACASMLADFVGA